MSLLLKPVLQLNCQILPDFALLAPLRIPAQRRRADRLYRCRGPFHQLQELQGQFLDFKLVFEQCLYTIQGSLHKELWGHEQKVHRGRSGPVFIKLGQGKKWKKEMDLQSQFAWRWWTSLQRLHWQVFHRNFKLKRKTSIPQTPKKSRRSLNKKIRSISGIRKKSIWKAINLLMMWTQPG